MLIILIFIDNSALDEKTATKSESKNEQDKVTKLQAFYSSYFHDKSHLDDDGT